MKLQVTVDDTLGHQLQNKAHALGFSTSSYVRYLIKNSLKKAQSNQIDLALADIKNDNIEAITLQDFKKQLEELY